MQTAKRIFAKVYICSMQKLEMVGNEIGFISTTRIYDMMQEEILEGEALAKGINFFHEVDECIATFVTC